MKYPFIIILLYGALTCQIFTNYSKSNKELRKIESRSLGNSATLIPINYDFKNLGLYLNSSAKSPTSKIEWRWDYMTADKGMPDSTGLDYFMNYEQPLFNFNDEETLPSLHIVTNKNKIIEFSATIIFTLADEQSETIQNLLDSIKTFDLLQDAKIRKSLIDNGSYHSSNDEVEETIKLEITKRKYGYDRITYEIKYKNSY